MIELFKSTYQDGAEVYLNPKEKDELIEYIKSLEEKIDRAYKEAKKQDEEADYQEETDLSIIVNILKGSDKE